MVGSVLLIVLVCCLSFCLFLIPYPYLYPYSSKPVCDQLGVPLQTVSLQKEYWRDVVQYTLAEAQRGRTPNPDVRCNSRVKFGTFYDYVGR